MKIGIYGAVDVGYVKDTSIPYIGVDQGAKHLLAQGIHPVIVIGDMDSSTIDISSASIVLPMHKDVTDTEAAIEYAINKGYSDIDLYGVTQKRLDHFHAILALLEKYKDINIYVYDYWNKITLLKPGTYKVFKEDYKYFSFFALDTCVITLDHCMYPLDHYILYRNDPLCVSNEALSDYMLITIDKEVIFYQTRD